MAKLSQLTEFIEFKLTGAVVPRTSKRVASSDSPKRRLLSDHRNFSSESTIWRKAITLELTRDLGSFVDRKAQARSVPKAQKTFVNARSSEKES